MFGKNTTFYFLKTRKESKFYPGRTQRRNTSRVVLKRCQIRSMHKIFHLLGLDKIFFIKRQKKIFTKDVLRDISSQVLYIISRNRGYGLEGRTRMKYSSYTKQLIRVKKQKIHKNSLKKREVISTLQYTYLINIQRILICREYTRLP